VDLLVVIAVNTTAFLAEDLRVVRFRCKPDYLVAAQRSHLVDGASPTSFEELAATLRTGGRLKDNLQIALVNAVVPPCSALRRKKA
jgi:hypothetical protein